MGGPHPTSQGALIQAALSGVGGAQGEGPPGMRLGVREDVWGSHMKGALRSRLMQRSPGLQGCGALIATVGGWGGMGWGWDGGGLGTPPSGPGVTILPLPLPQPQRPGH